MKDNPKMEGFAIEWEVEPFLWRGDESKTLVRDGIKFEVDCKKIRAEGEWTVLEHEDFEIRAEGYARTIALVFGLIKGMNFGVKICKRESYKDGKWIALVVCRARIKLQDSFAATVVDAEGNIIRDTEEEARQRAWEIVNLVEGNETLKGALDYYRLASEGLDQLAVAGNLYMVMEELWNNPDFGGQESLATLLQLESPAGINKTLKKWWGEIHRARHAYDKEGNKLDPLSNEELDVFKRFVREAILAYVEWLKDNS